MNILLRDWLQSDIPFLRKMLYEAVFWRAGANGPPFEEGLAYPDVSKSLADWGERDGDTAVVATINSNPIGAAWYRYWIDDNFINGYVDKSTPVLVIGVHTDYRHQGIGGKMINWLIGSASMHCIQKLSLSVSKDNFAINLYRQQGFKEYVDNGDAFTMVRKI
ncbi:MAG: GNAT family N-acetyltransferase [Anaerolineaceae bacterium]|nr:GNAT family N-acetyltransferase [Anaerolineaceae bacterium]